MTASQWVVTVAGAGAIAWVIYYFFLAARPVVTAQVQTGLQRVAIEVLGGYTPSSVTVQRGVPVQLEFHRADTDSCTEEVVLDAFGIRRFLPAYQTTPIRFTPTEVGTFDFSCGMGMVHGRLIVRDGAPNARRN